MLSPSTTIEGPVTYDHFPEQIKEKPEYVNRAKAVQEERKKKPLLLTVNKREMKKVFGVYPGPQQSHAFGTYINQRALPEIVTGTTRRLREQVLAVLERHFPAEKFTPSDEIFAELEGLDICYESDRIRRPNKSTHPNAKSLWHDSIHCTVRQYLKRPPYPAFLCGPSKVNTEFLQDVDLYGPEVAKMISMETMEEELFAGLWGGLAPPHHSVLENLLMELKAQSQKNSRMRRKANIAPCTKISEMTDEQLFRAYMFNSIWYFIRTLQLFLGEHADYPEIKEKFIDRLVLLLNSPPKGLESLFKVALKTQFNLKTGEKDPSKTGLFDLWQNIAEGRCTMDNIKKFYLESNFSDRL